MGHGKGGWVNVYIPVHLAFFKAKNWFRVIRGFISIFHEGSSTTVGRLSKSISALARAAFAPSRAEEELILFTN